MSTRAAGRDQARQPSRSRPLSLPGVAIESLVFDARSATARVDRTAFQGPRFQSYEVLRRSGDLGEQTICIEADAATTAFVDSGLHGNTEYSYRVAVVTGLGERVVSAESSGRFHALTHSWPLYLEQDSAVRLYGRPEGGVEALVNTPFEVSLLTLGATGDIVASQTLHDPLDKGGMASRLASHQWNWSSTRATKCASECRELNSRLPMCSPDTSSNGPPCTSRTAAPWPRSPTPTSGSTSAPSQASPSPW